MIFKVELSSPNFQPPPMRDGDEAVLWGTSPLQTRTPTPHVRAAPGCGAADAGERGAFTQEEAANVK